MANHLYPFFSLLLFTSSLFLISKNFNRLLWIQTSIVFLLFAFLISILHFGIEFGITYGLFSLYISALLNILVKKNKKKINHKITFKKKRIKRKNQTALWRYKLLRFIFAGPISCMAALIMCSGFCWLMPIPISNQLVLAAFLYPLFWTVIAFLCCRFQRKKTIDATLETIA